MLLKLTGYGFSERQDRISIVQFNFGQFISYLPLSVLFFSLLSRIVPFLICALLPCPLISIFFFYSSLASIYIIHPSSFPSLPAVFSAFCRSAHLCLACFGFSKCSGTMEEKKEGQRSQSSRAAGHAGRPETAAQRMCVRSSPLTLPKNPDPLLKRAARRREKSHSVMDKSGDVGERDEPALCGHHDIYRKSLRTRLRVTSSVSVWIWCRMTFKKLKTSSLK